MIKIGIIGGTGYTGVELLRILARHPAGAACCDHLAQRDWHAGRGDVSQLARFCRS